MLSDPDDDPMLVLGTGLLDAILEVGGREGKTVLTAVGQVDRGPLGRAARARAACLPADPIPDWMPQVGNAKIVRAFASHSPGDGEALLLEAERAGEDSHMVAAFISELLGGIAKHLGLIRAIDPSDPANCDPGGDAAGSARQFRQVDAILACRRVRVAIERTDATMAAPVGEGFSEHRALVLARVMSSPITLLGV